ncbi:MAG: DNA repair protein RecN [Bacteroidales bacterium]|nr:DNA repair protein RecN [Bacteroidales bacterium]
MLSRLQVRNYVLIDSLETSFPEGLIIITGQTGAGKSILMGALSLCLGAKADASMIGPDGDSCVVEAVFEAGDDDALKEKLQADDLPWQDGHLVIRRVVHSSGRSRSFLNDEPVTLARLQEVSSHLVDVHAQHQTLLLQDPSFRMKLLDHFAGNKALLEECGQAWADWQKARKELADAESRLRSLEADRDYNQARYERLEAASLKEGELADLEQRQQQLAHAEEIKEVLEGARGLMETEDGTPLPALLKDVVRKLEKGSRFIPQLQQLAERLESSRLEIEDISAEVESASEKIEVSPAALQQVEDRMSLIYDLMKRYGVNSEQELISVRDSLAEALAGSSALAEDMEALRKRESACADAYRRSASSLHDEREKACAPFSASVLESLRFLELENCRFITRVSASTPSATGTDTVEFLFSAGSNEPVDVAKGASGGELSRIMLSLKAMLAKYTSMPTMVFDEIDTGVSGSAADRMGSMICSMGKDMQVFAITHLPQVAAKGKAHYLVSREDGRTGISRISGEERVMEISRMLSGSRITEAAIENARVLISEG